MMFTPASSTSVVFFLMTILWVLISIVVGVYVASNRLGRSGVKRAIGVSLGLSSWLLWVSWVVSSGVLEAAPMPRVLLFFWGVNLVGVLFALSPVGGWLASALSIQALVGFQIFRLPLELVLHSWVDQGTIPSSMTWSGSNFDFLSGIAALIAVPFLHKNRSLAWFFNLVGFLLLVNVGRVAVMSSPFPFAWKVSPPLQLVFHLPYAWIIPVSVAGALAGHVVLTRALLLKRTRA